MGSIGDYINTPFVGGIRHFSNRHNLSTPVDQVRNHHYFGAIRKSPGINSSKFILIFRRQGQINPYQFNAIPLLPLLPGIDHVGVILF